jgi:hypothetical protein
MVAFRLSELPPLLNRRFHHSLVIFGERYVRPVRFEWTSVNVKTWAKRFQRRF